MSKNRKALLTLAGFLTVIAMALALLLWSYNCMAADLSLSWDPADGATGYKVQISTTQGASWGETRDAGSQNTFTWTGAPDVGLILFRASAYNAQGEAINYTKGAWFNGAWNPPAQAGGLGLK